MDDEEVARFLELRLGEPIAGLRRLRGGEWSRAYAFQQGERALVARFGATDEDYLKDRSAWRFRSPALPIPRVFEVGPTFDGFFAISEFVAGESLDDLTGERMRRLLPSLFGMLDAIRLADVSHRSGFGAWEAGGNGPFGSWSAFLLESGPGNRIVGWRERLAASPTGMRPYETAYARLAAIVPSLPDVRHLCHCDLLNHNVFVSGDRVSGVLDWGNSIYGDFLFDLAWFCFWAPWYPAWAEIDFAAEAAAHFEAIGLDVPSSHERLLACELRIGLDGQGYCAFKERWEDVEAIAQRTLDLAERD